MIKLFNFHGMKRFLTLDLYVAYSLYHLFITINLAIHENKNHPGELIVVSSNTGIEAMTKIVSASGLFSKVHILNDQQIKIFLGDPNRSFLMKAARRIGRNILNLPFILSQRRYRMMPFYGKQYRYIYLPQSGGYLDGFVAKQVKGGARLFSIEDGVGDRMGSFDSIPFMFKIFGWLGAKSHWHFISARYLFNPEMSISKPYFPIIPQIRPTENDAEIFQKIFQYSPQNDPLVECEFIYYTQHSFDEPKLIHDIYPFIDSLVIKKHPASKENYPGARIIDTKIPFEVSCIFWDMDEKVLISPHSACMFNPKYVFDKEPYLIFTYKLLPKYVPFLRKEIPGIEMSDIDDITKKTLVDHYRCPEKIFIPSTIEEFEQAINRIKEMKRNSNSDIFSAQNEKG